MLTVTSTPWSRTGIIIFAFLLSQLCRAERVEFAKFLFSCWNRHCSFPHIGGFPPISRGFLTPLRSAQISGVNGPVCRGVGGLELAITKQNRLKMARFSPESFPIEQSLWKYFQNLYSPPFLTQWLCCVNLQLLKKPGFSYLGVLTPL